MLIQIDKRHIINPDKVVSITLKDITLENDYLPFQDVETHVVRIYFDNGGYLDCDIKLDEFTTLLNRIGGIKCHEK